MNKKKPSKANALTASILNYLTLKGYVVWRNNTTGIFDIGIFSAMVIKKAFTPGYAIECAKKSFRKSHDRLGVPDIIGFNKSTGLFIAVEIKVCKDKLSDHQLHFKKEIEKSGAIYIIAADIDDVLTANC